jgi:hypothetical protein
MNMAIRPLTEAAYNAGVTIWSDGSFTFVQFPNDANFYSTNGTPLAGQQLTMAQSIAAGGLPAPIGESPPIDWSIAASS